MKRLFTAILSASTFFAWPAFGAPPPIQGQEFANQNILVNPGFENGSYAWTASGGATTQANATAKGLGTYGYQWDSNSASQTLQSQAVTVPAGLMGRNGLARCAIKVPSGTATHTMTVTDGTNDLVSPVTITSSASSFFVHDVNFVFPTSGSVRIKLTSVASNEPAIYVDDCYLGAAINLVNVSQAEAIVMVRRATSSQAIASVNPTTIVMNVKDLDAYGEWDTATGTLTAKRRGRLTISANVAVTSYTADERLNLLVYKNNVAVSGCFGSNNMAGTTTFVAMPVCEISVEIGDLVNIVADSISDANYDVDSGGATWASFVWYPPTNEIAARSEALAWRVDANISGANPSLGTSAVTSYTGIENGSLTLTNNSGTGTLAAQIPCSSTNSPTGTTCSSGNESVGVSFTLPKAGDVLACASFTWYAQTAASAGAGATAAFNVVETAANAQTILQEGKTRSTARITTPATQNMDLAAPFRVCGTFTFASAGQKTLRLMYEQAISSSGVATSQIQADADSNNGQRDIHWEVYPIAQGYPFPSYVGSVTSNATGALRHEYARLNCQATSAVTTQSGSWVSSIGNVSSGACTVTLATGAFSSTPVCASGSETDNSGAPVILRVAPTSATSVTIDCATDAGSACSNYSVGLICSGPR